MSSLMNSNKIWKIFYVSFDLTTLCIQDNKHRDKQTHNKHSDKQTNKLTDNQLRKYACRKERLVQPTWKIGTNSNAEKVSFINQKQKTVFFVRKKVLQP
jgi:hypothetical protein